MHLVIRKADVRLLGKGNSNSHGARPVHQIIFVAMRVFSFVLYSVLCTCDAGRERREEGGERW